MAIVLKFAKALRNNWKKSCFFAAVSVYGVKYARDRHEEEQIRRVYCAEATQYGHEHITLTQRPKKIYVFLNPAAHGNKGRKLFEKNAAPLLHLAGLEVVLVKTEYESQAKEFMSVIEVEDAHSIVVAGGDGTLSEVVTGILRKGNRKFEKSVPIGIIPLGNTNRFARKWFGYGSQKNTVQVIADSAMAVIKGRIKPVDVLSIKGDDGKATYAMSGLEIGAYRDAVARKNKYWYFGPLKYRWTYIRTIMKDWPPTIKGRLQYIPSDIQITSRSNKVESSEQKTGGSSEGWSWWNLFYRSRPVPAELYEDDGDDDEGFDSEAEISRDIDTVELTLMSGLFGEKSAENGCPSVKHVDIGIGPSFPSRIELLWEGWRRINSDSLLLGTEANEHLSARKIRFSPELTEHEELWFTIDGEHYEAKPVEISVLKNRLYFYCSNEAATG